MKGIGIADILRYQRWTLRPFITPSLGDIVSYKAAVFVGWNMSMDIVYCNPSAILPKPWQAAYSNRSGPRRGAFA